MVVDGHVINLGNSTYRGTLLGRLLHVCGVEMIDE